jgi:hypothetical protein
MMMLRITSVLLTAALLAQPLVNDAQASVLYTWHQTAASENMPTGMNLEMVFSDAAVKQGKLKLDVETSCYNDLCIDPQNSLLSLKFWYQQDNGDGTFSRNNYINYHYRSYPHYGADMVRLNLDFLSNGMLSGSILANDTNTHIIMESVGSSFEMIDMRSDVGPCGDMDVYCYGEVGELRVEVPEPSSAAIAGLGLLAAWFGRRRRR